ncbi:MAG: endolytic transglycosylase MltG [Candidatus Saccharibacteria bacterium]|nr:endolytic transglycosylase MltG [Candidatus Saccharibacteria bacterium]
MLILGLDVGEKRIGVAKADSNIKIAIPISTIEVDGNEFQEIARLTRLYNTGAVVLGLPRSNEGNETAQSLYVRNFAKTLTEKVPNVKINFQDESLTSVEAEKRLKARKKTYEKGEIDAEAASIILQDFIENFREKAETTPKKTNLAEKTSQKIMLESKKATHKSKKFLKLLVIPPIVLFLLLVLLGGFLWYKNSLNGSTLNCNDDCPVITVNDGDSTDTIIKNLSEKGLIGNELAFKIYLKLERSNTVFKSGTYYFENGRAYSAGDIVDILELGGGSDNVFTFTVLPGETIFDIKKKLLKLGYEQTEIDEAFNKRKYEGYLYGETHEFYKETPVTEILETFYAEMERIIKENDLENKYAAHGLTLDQGITLASVVQKEAHGKEQPTVAQVFLSRISYGIPLGSDVTVSYALDVIDPERQIYKDNQSALLVDSCYNTRRYAGLPCGPISSPSLSALLAVANPSETSYLYFLTGDDGTMYYSYTEAEHNQKIRDYCQVLCNVSL